MEISNPFNSLVHTVKSVDLLLRAARASPGFSASAGPTLALVSYCRSMTIIETA